MTRPSDPIAPAPKTDPMREARLAAALRANLKRRKAQSRPAREADAEEVES